MGNSKCKGISSGMVVMSTKEMDYAAVMRLVSSGDLSKAVAARRLQINRRQVHRLYAAWLVTGDAGLAHKGRGRSGNRAKTEE